MLVKLRVYLIHCNENRIELLLDIYEEFYRKISSAPFLKILK